MSSEEGFPLTETDRKVLQALKKHNIEPCIALDNALSVRNFGCINFYRRLRIASWIYGSKIKREVLLRRARLCATSHKFVLEFLDALVVEGVIKFSNGEYEWIEEKE